jgi:hypothetical protein
MKGNNMDNIIDFDKAAKLINRKYFRRKISKFFYWRLIKKLSEWAMIADNLINEQKNIK